MIKPTSSKAPTNIFWLFIAVIFVCIAITNAVAIVYAANGTAGSGGTGGTVPAGSGTSGTAGGEGSAGDPDGGGGGGGGGAGGAGAAGGNGAGGGVVLSAATTVSVSGTVDARGGGSSTINGGTVKLFYNAASDPTTSGITAGRIALLGNLFPGVPTLTSPANSATGIAILPRFIFYAVDPDDDYVRYRLQVCSNSDCSAVVRTIDQTLSQTGWLSQSLQSGTAYSGAASNAQSALHDYQTPALTASTQYWWRAQSIDPGGTNTWSSYSGIGTFTTGADPANQTQVNIKGNVNIGGDVIIRP